MQWSVSHTYVNFTVYGGSDCAQIYVTRPLLDLLIITDQLTSSCFVVRAKVLGKSAKPIPVMVLGVLLARKKYPWLKYLFVLMITTGVAMFMYKPSKVQAASEALPVFGWGEFLLVSVYELIAGYSLLCISHKLIIRSKFFFLNYLTL